ncbi:hypothetical protein FNV43_RR14791 [Rhamnella rubrinervis]|uniref:Glycosyltransferase n=1 Tax=Rhamnella rubrinervis TaxID=2594499 RepID=A0A8K0H3R4_9ROSA|nr:hypothetical protein FNV43_RR14791 [Rhamnella rubrinervis]
MSSTEVAHQMPHAVCIPYPAQSHIKAMLKFAKLLHHRGFHITFVNTEFNHNRFLKSLGHKAFDGLPDFRFEAIPDGLPASEAEATQDIPALCDSIRNNLSLPPFLDLLTRINNTASTSCNVPPVTCIFSDWLMFFTVHAAEELGIPLIMFITLAACGFMGFYQYSALIEKGLVPLKDEGCLTNGFMDTVIDWIPGMKGLRLKDLPTFFRTTNPHDIMLNYVIEASERVHKASALVIQTLEVLEGDVLDALPSTLPNNVYAIGPIQLHLDCLPKDHTNHVGYSLLKEDTECLQWLNSKPPNSVLYVNFGSVIVMTSQQLVEFGKGLAKSMHAFLWVIRPDLVVGQSAILPPEFEREIKGRGLIASWCPQEQVLNHPSIGGFLTHCGWNSILESITAGVPILCWPIFADQQTNSWYACNEWGFGIEIDGDVKSGEVEKLVRELMEGDKGKQMKSKALEWKKLAEEATGSHGSSSTNLDSLIDDLMLLRKTSY